MGTIVDKMDYLTETKDEIKNAIINKGVFVADTDTFRDYATKIGQIEGGGEPTEEWQPEPDWWDIQSILDNDEEEYTQKVICLLTDELDDSMQTMEIKGGTKYKLSDGQTITTSATATKNITDIFDTTQDKSCSKGYKTRYIIMYNNSNSSISFTFPKNSLYIICNENVKASGFALFSELHFLKCAKYSENLLDESTSSVQKMFYNCYSLEKAYPLNSSHITTFSEMFRYCYSIKKIPYFDTSSATTFSAIFSSCLSVEEIPNLDTSNVTTMYSMFFECYSIKKIPSFNTTSKVTNMESMFSGCRNLETLDLSNYDTSKVTSMKSMFSGCNKLKTLNTDNFNTSSVKDVYYMFNSCHSLENIPLIDTSNATKFSYMFSSCYSLKSIPNLNTDNVSSNSNSMTGLFNGCYKLTNIQISKIQDTQNLSSVIYLSHQSLLNILNALVDLTGQTALKLTLGSTNLAKLTDEEKAIATNKNWTLA